MILAKTELKNLHIKTVDTSVSSDKLDFYKDFDLHVGYRLHGHIKCLSVGVPSILIAEDSRGLGQKYTLNNIGAFTAFEFDLQDDTNLVYKNIFERIFSVKILYSCSKYLVVTLFGIKIKKNLGDINKYIKKSQVLIEEIDNHIDYSIYTNWTFYSMIPITINTIYKDLFLPFLRKSINNVTRIPSI